MSGGEFILWILAIITGIILLGRYAIREGQRIESQKKFMRDMEEYDKKLKKLKK